MTSRLYHTLASVSTQKGEKGEQISLFFFAFFGTKHKAPNGGCRSDPPSGCKKNIKTLGFFEKSPKPKKLLNHSVGTRRVAEVRPSKRDGRTSFTSVSLPFHQGTGSIFFENLHPKPLTARIFAVSLRRRQRGTGFINPAPAAVRSILRQNRLHLCAEHRQPLRGYAPHTPGLKQGTGGEKTLRFNVHN